jgi:hypothetical protein
MKTFPHLRQYLPEFFLESEIFQIQVAEKIKTHCMLHNVFPKIVPFEMSKNTEPEKPACWISKATRAQAHARAGYTHTRTEIRNAYCLSTVTMLS